MQFIFPTFLWALLVLAVPIIIHLFHFRRFKKVYFTNVHLLKEIKEETSSRSKLRNLLVLLVRMLAFAMLVLAFAQPILKTDSTTSSKDRLIVIFIDNSFSMSATKDEVPLIRLAKDRALQIVNAYDETDRFMVLTHDLESKHQRIVDQSTVVGFIDDIILSPKVREIEDILKVADRITQNATAYEKHHFLISDFQENITVFESRRDSLFKGSLLPIRSVQESNVALKAAYLEAPIPLPEQTNNIIIEVANYSPQANEVQLNLQYKDQIRPQGIVSLKPNSVVYDTIQLPVNGSGWHEFEISIEDYPVQFDDRLYGSFEIKEQVDILAIHESASNTYLKSAFESIDYYSLREVNKQAVRYDQFAGQELIILDDLSDLSSGLIAELSNYVSQGGNLMVFPSARANLGSYNQMLDRMGADRYGKLIQEPKKVASINTQEFIFSDVFLTKRRALRLPLTQLSFSVTNIQSRSSDALLSFRDGSLFLAKHTFDKGNIYTCTAPLNTEYNDLVLNAEIFVPMLYKSALSSGLKKPIYYTIGTDEHIPFDLPVSSENGNYLIRGDIEFIPGIVTTNRNTTLEIKDQIRKSGFYSLFREGISLGNLAFNYDRMESDVRLGDVEKIATGLGKNVVVINDTALADLTGFIEESQHGINLWRWCILFSLLLLLIESLLLRFWK